MVKKNKNKIIILLVIFCILILFLNNSYGFENRLDNIPDISTLTKDDLDLPSSFDLRDVNGVNYTTPLKNQGKYGLCWAFSATTAFESVLKRSGYVDNNFNEWFSPYQVDALVTKNVKIPDINYVTDDKNRKLNDGDYIETNYAYKAFTTAYSPVLMTTFDEDKYKDAYKLGHSFYAEDIYNEKNSNYYVTDFDVLTEINDISVIDVVKYYVYNYGGVTIGTFSPHKFCQNFDEICYIKSVTDPNAGGHAMTIIGWDDSENSWILQNSWGDKLSYIYLSYDSEIHKYLAIKNISTTSSWDNRYYPATTQSGQRYYSYYKIPNNEEKINSILVDIKKTGNYKVYLSTDWDENYELISSFKASFIGRKTIKLLDKNILIGDSVLDKFFIKIYDEDTNIITDRYSIGEDVYVFTNDVSNTDDKKLYIYDVNDITSGFQTFSIKYKSINIDKEKLSFTIKNNLGEDVTNKFVLKSSYFSNNYGQLDYKINLEDSTSNEKYTIEALDNGNIISSKEFNVLNFQSVNFKYGNGSAEDPFIITNSSQFKTIASDNRFLKYSYKLANDIDMTGVDFNPIGDYNYPFTGIFDGNNYSIKNINISSNEQTDYYGFFGAIENATIKNLKFKNSNIEINNNPNTDVYGGLLVGEARSSIIDNVYIEEGSMNIFHGGSFGSLIGYSSNSNIFNVYSSLNINIDVSSYEVNIGGIIGNIYNSIDQKSNIYFSEYNGRIHIINKSYSSKIGGMIGKLTNGVVFNNTIVSTTIINDALDKYVGYFVGYYNDNIIIMNSLFYKNNDQIDIVGKESGDVIDEIEKYDNLYAIVDYDGSEGYINKNGNNYLNINTYNFDFENIWYMSNNGPVLKSLSVDLLDKTNFIGESNIYDVDYEKRIISNVKSDNGTVTRKDFVSDFISFTGEIYNENEELVIDDDTIIKSNMIVRKNNIDYKIAINGDVNSDGRINPLDIVIMRRYIVGGYNINLEDYQLKSADLDQDGKISVKDVIYLSRGIVGGYEKECSYIWRSCE